ncbi:hypothetical protein AB870_08330 [Pandoraea faecigallinarum]|uniref:Uncharacterized protein n=1 Tax=Pandoraea faecigallinarum TaxID=656179 RepID=A0A0H3WPL7_9BURK|nr:hypothetical protein AB870_08330 [Pandoraea faecigallinarum]
MTDGGVEAADAVDAELVANAVVEGFVGELAGRVPAAAPGATSVGDAASPAFTGVSVPVSSAGGSQR